MFLYFDICFILLLILHCILTTFSEKLYFINSNKIRVPTYTNIIILSYKIMFFFAFLTMIQLLVKSKFTYIIYFDNIFITKFFVYLFLFLFLFLFNSLVKLLKIYNFEFVYVFFFSIFFLNILVQCDNLIAVYIVLEGYTLTFCSVLVLKKFTKKLIEAAFKYLIINIISSAIFLFGISYIYFASGLLSITEINKTLFFSDLYVFERFLYIGYFIVMLAFVIKLALFPFSLYLLEIYSEINSGLLFFLLTIPKFVFISFLYNFFSNFPYVSYWFVLITFYFIFLTSFIHSILSVSTQNIKSMIINLSFSNAPFMIICLYHKSVFIYAAFLNFILIYYINLFCFFSIIFVFCKGNFFAAKKINDLTAIIKINPALTFILFVNLLSMASLPPFSGFFGKLYIYYILIDSKMYFLYFLLNFINLVVIYSYLRIIRLLFLKKRNINLKYINIKKSFLSFLVCFFTLFNILSIFFFDTIYYIIMIIYFYITGF